MNKVNPSPALTVPFPLIFLPNLFTAFKAAFEAYCLLTQTNYF